MNSELLALLAEKNSTDIEAIVTKVGLPTLIALIPYIANILKTVQTVQQPKTA